FVTPLTFQSLTRRPVYTDLYDVLPDYSSAHVELGSRADVLVVCPATATTLARLAQGLADDMLACVALASPAPLVLAPAMNVNMWQHPATQENVARLRQRGALFVGPVVGRLAEGIVAMGRLAPLEDVLAAVRVALGRAQKSVLAGRRLVVTAGGTQEPIDPVRFIGNRSSGKMGYAIAEAARDRGAQVTLISGPVALPRPWGLEVITVATAREMAAALMEATRGCDALIMAAAPADFRPAHAADHKIKRSAEGLRIDLVPNEDIIAGLQGGFVKVGFAAETQDMRENARAKIRTKGLDLIAANDVSAPQAGFAVDTNLVTLIDKDGAVEELPLLTKYEVGNRILDRVAALLASRE